MASQYQIEQGAGIDEATAEYMMAQETSAARNAMSLLKMCVNRFEQGAYTLLKEAVKDCKEEMKCG